MMIGMRNWTMPRSFGVPSPSASVSTGKLTVFVNDQNGRENAKSD